MDHTNAIEPRPTVGRPLEKWRPLPSGSTPEGEKELFPDLLAYWRILRRRRWIVFGIFFVVFTGILLGSVLSKKIYRASGLLEIGKENPEILSVDALFTLQAVSDGYLRTQFEVLKSATLAERVIKQLNLEQTQEFNPPAPWWSTSRWFSSAPPRSAAKVFQGVLDRFQEQLTIEPVKGSRVVRISFDSEDPQRAAQVVNALLSSYVDLRMETSRKAADWLSAQLTSTKADLERSEQELQRYARRSGLMFLEGNKGASENIANERLRQLQQELTKAQAVRYEKQALYKLVQEGDYDSLPGIADNKLMQDLTVRLAELWREEAQLATTFTPEYPKVKQVRSQVQELETALRQERKRAADRITNEYLAAVQRESLLWEGFQQQQQLAGVMGERSGQYNILKRDVETNRQLYEVLQQKLKEADVSAAMKAGNVGIVDRAKPPQSPDRPKLALDLALALLAGLGLGIGGAFLREYLDTSLRSTEEVDRFLDVPGLGMIPSVDSLSGQHFPGFRVSEATRLLPFRARKASALDAPRWHRIDTDRTAYSPLAEAFGCLRTAVMLSTDGPPPRALLVTSPRPAEGKTTVASNLAISLAQLGQRVLLVDADVRRPAVHMPFSLDNREGLVNYLRGEQDWAGLVQPSPVAGLDLLTSGPSPANPAELLSSQRMRDLVNQAALDYNFVIVDSPALLINAADARILAGLADGVVLVVRSGATPRSVVMRARAQVQNVIGVILNQLDASEFPGYYQDYYAAEPEGEEPRAPHREPEIAVEVSGSEVVTEIVSEG